jgi:hypothetical protein
VGLESFISERTNKTVRYLFHKFFFFFFLID